MRISKLFHWLYASIMLMPIFAIGVKSLYVTFNPNSKDSYYGETINQEQIKQQTNINLQVNVHYYVDGKTFASSDTFNNENSLVYYSVLNWKGVTYTDGFFFITKNTGTSSYFRINGAPLDSNSIVTSQTPFDFIYSGTSYLTQTTIDLWQPYYIEINDYSYIDNVFYYSVEQISNENLFSWASSSFLAQPLLLITNLFGVPTTSPIITILSYWFAVSIIWLVFDAFMYFPLLIHRWLDKGVLE